MTLARCSHLVLAAVVSLVTPAQLTGQYLPSSNELDWQVPASGGATAPPQLIGSAVPKSPGRALALSVGGTLLPIAAGIVVLATRPRGDPETGEPADETFDVVGGILIGLGAGVGPSLGHFYAHELGLVVPRVLVGGVLGLAAAGSDMETGGALALVGITAVSVMAARDIATAKAAARRYNARRLGLALDLARQEGRLGLRLGVAIRP